MSRTYSNTHLATLATVLAFAVLLHHSVAARPNNSKGTAKTSAGTAEPIRVVDDVSSYYSAYGGYIVISLPVIEQVVNELDLNLTDQLDGYTLTPDYSGSGSGSTFTFSSFWYDATVEGFDYTVSGTTATFTWSTVTFAMGFNYHVVVNDWPNPAESGWVEITTLDAQQMSVTATVDLSGPTLDVTVTAVVLSGPADSINIFVQCTDTICLIPTSDIADGIADSFVSAFESAVLNAINTVAVPMLNSYPTIIPAPDVDVSIGVAGDLAFAENTTNLILNTAALLLSDSTEKPPFTNDFVPPSSAFDIAPGTVSLIVTNYYLDVVGWAMYTTGTLSNLVVTNADLPANFPFTLSTSDLLFKIAAPGLESYPDMNITVTIDSSWAPTVDIANGVVTAPNLGAVVNMSLSNSTTTLPGFAVQVNATAALNFTIGTDGSSLILNASVSGSPKFNVSIIETQIGTVSTSGLGAILNAFGIFLKTEGSGTSVVVPEFPDFDTTDPYLYIEDGYMVMGATTTFTPTSQSIPCPGDPLGYCAIGATCCSDGCCDLEGASCCSTGGCCPSGTTCYNSLCYYS